MGVKIQHRENKKTDEEYRDKTGQKDPQLSSSGAVESGVTPHPTLFHFSVHLRVTWAPGMWPLYDFSVSR